MTLTVGRTMFGLAALGAVLTLVVGGVGYWSVQGTAARTSAVLAGEAKIAEHAASVRALVLGMRRFEKDLFLNLGDAAKEAGYAKTWEEQRQRLAGHLDTLDGLAALPEDRERVRHMRVDLAGYVAGMTRVRERIAGGAIRTPEQGNAAIGSVKPATHSLEKLAEELAAAGVARMGQIEASLAAAARRDQLIVVALALIAVVAGLATSVLIARGITGPLARAVAALDATASGDLTARLDADGADELARMARSLNEALATIGDALAMVRTEAASAAVAARQLSATSEQLATGAQEQASSLEETAASLQQITGTVKQTADNVRQVNALAEASRAAAERGGAVVHDAVVAMGEINRSSKRIADIITTIDEIAFQTNLLALNAAVEAARAGEQGRGFAVVAAEVRNLAQRSATAAKEIKGLIQDSVGKVEVGSELVNKSGATLQEIVGSVKRVTDVIGEIAAASREQATGVDQVNQAVTQMDRVVQANAAQTEEMSSTAQALAAQAGRLQELVGRFKVAEAYPATGAPATRVAIKPVPGKASVVKRAARPVAAGRAKAAGSEPVAAPPAGNGHQDGFEEF